MRPTVEWLKENYKKYNDLCFGGELPYNIELNVKAGLPGNPLAHATFWASRPITPRAIEFNGMYNFTEEGMVNVLVHEMIHILDFYKYPEHYDSRTYKCHGAWFKAEARRIMALTGLKIDTYAEYNTYFVNQTKDVDFSSEKAPTFVGFCKLVNKTNLFSWWMVRLQRRRVEQFIEGLKISYENGKPMVAYIDWYKSKVRNGSEYIDRKPRSWVDRLNDAEKEEEIKKDKLEYFTRTEIVPGFDESAESEMSALGNQYQSECVDIVKRVFDDIGNGKTEGGLSTSSFFVRYEVTDGRSFDGKEHKYAMIKATSKSSFNPKTVSETFVLDSQKPIEYFAKELFVDIMNYFPKRFREQKMNIKKIIREVVDKFIEDETEDFNPDYPKIYKTKDGHYIGVVS